MAVTNRGGHPFATSFTATTGGVIALTGVANSAQPAGAPLTLRAPTTWVRFAVSTNSVRIYFTQADYDADLNYLSIASSGIVEAPIDVKQLWAKGQSGTATVEILAAAKAS